MNYTSGDSLENITHLIEVSREDENKLSLITEVLLPAKVPVKKILLYDPQQKMPDASAYVSGIVWLPSSVLSMSYSQAVVAYLSEIDKHNPPVVSEGHVSAGLVERVLSGCEMIPNWYWRRAEMWNRKKKPMQR